LFDLANAFHESIRQVDTQKPIGSTRRINYALCFFQVASERLLTENGYSTLESGDCLIRMQGAGGGDHNSVDAGAQQLFVLGQLNAARR